MNLEVRVLVGLLWVVVHVVAVVVVLSVGHEFWRGREGLGDRVEWPQRSMEGGGESVFLWGRRRGSGRAVEDIRHCEDLKAPEVKKTESLTAEKEEEKTGMGRREGGWRGNAGRSYSG